MDYPKSDPRVGLHNGKFTDGSADGTIKPSLDTAAHDNALTDEILNVIRVAGLEPNEAKVDQMAEAITKLIADNSSQDFKPSCRVATTGNIVLSGTQTVDGVALVAGNRVLVKAQTTGTENGIYVVAAGAWTRAADADDGAELSPGAVVPIEEGTQNANSLWMVATDGAVTIGTTALTFERVGGDGMPLGSVVIHSGSTAPAGYLIANGAAVSRTTYAALDAAMYVGDALNATAPAYYRCTDSGNPTGTRSTAGAYLVLPDYRGVMLRGLDAGRGLDPDGGTRVVNSYQADEFKSHFHTVVQVLNGVGSEQITPTAGTAARVNYTNAAGGAETRSKNTAVLICIKAFSAGTNQGLIDITALADEVAGKLAISALGVGAVGTSGYLPIPYRDVTTGEIRRAIMQWGTTAFYNDMLQRDYGTITFPVAFPAECLNVMASMYSSVLVVDSNVFNVTTYNATQTGVGIFLDAVANPIAASNHAVRWFAIGR